jgi:hypothetical protein
MEKYFIDLLQKFREMMSEQRYNFNYKKIII